MTKYIVSFEINNQEIHIFIEKKPIIYIWNIISIIHSLSKHVHFLPKNVLGNHEKYTCRGLYILYISDR